MTTPILAIYIWSVNHSDNMGDQVWLGEGHEENPTWPGFRLLTSIVNNWVL